MDAARLLSSGGVEASPAWLKLAAQMLAGYRSHPLVLRHHSRNLGEHYQADVSVRRWSEAAFLRLGQTPEDSEVQLLFSAQGQLWLCRPQRRRWLRRHDHEQIYDDIYQLEAVTGQAPPWQFERVLNCLIQQKGMLFWQSWSQLDPAQHLRLVGIPQDWGVLGGALEQSPEIAGQALPLLLSEQAHPACRSALLNAGAEGLYAPPAPTLPWLLLQPDWNSSPGLVGLAGASLRRHPAQAWQLREHPNPLLRQRLAQSLPALQPWLEWLALESEDEVRRQIRLRLEAETDVPALLGELEQGRLSPGLAGWLLAHWSVPWDRAALNGRQRSLLARSLSPALLRRLRLAS